MTPAGFALALTVGVIFGGFLGVAWDRWQRRYDDHRPSYQRKAVSKERLARMHVIESDHWDER